MTFNVASHCRKELCKRHNSYRVISLEEIVSDYEDSKLIK
jgi:hypothetical protein